jgi:5-formyltetrahydrofolate cyclo-ligase
MSQPGLVAYVQVTHALRGMVLAMPWDSDDMLPPEPVLMERFQVSRGTLRRATEELAREGLLIVERGRGTRVRRQAQLRAMMRERLERLAMPDSRWHLDVLRFVPDFAGSTEARSRLRGHAAMEDARIVFVAPDNSLTGLVEDLLADGVRVLIPTYGMRRGMVLLEPDRIAASDRAFAATLDGLERFGRALDLDALRRLDRVDALVTGGIAFTLAGVHVGSGSAYLDLEWGVLATLGLVDVRTPVLGLAHDEQLVDIPLAHKPLDVTVDAIATPTRVVATTGERSRPAGISSALLSSAQIDEIAYLGELVLSDRGIR